MKTQFYVSPQGQDTWGGRLPAPNRQGTDGPFATLNRARDAARQVGARQPRRIVIREGAYREVDLQLGPGDSGLTLEAAPGETPHLFGGRRVTGWAKESESFWAAPIPGAKERTWDFRLLLVNGSVRPRARWPRDGALEHLSAFPVRWISTTGGGWERKPTEQELATMKYKPGDLGPWLDVNNAELTVYHQWDESMVGVKTLDDAAQTVTFSTPAGHPPGAFGARHPKARTYVVWNVREGMQEPGQWYLDRTTGKLVYWPLPGEDMATAEVIAPTTESVIRLDGTAEAPVTGIVVKGLRISATATPLASGGFAASRFDGAVAALFARDCRLANLTVRGVGGQGIKLRECADVRIENCEITATGAGGIYAFDSERAVIERNHIHAVGHTYPSAMAVNVTGRHHRITRNDIHDTPYTGIGCSASQSLIEANRFDRVMSVLQDGGAIYVTFCREVTVRGNTVRGPGAGGALAHAYYLDEQAENCVVEKNLAVNTGWPSHNHMAGNGMIRENVFVDEGPSRLTFMKCADFTLERNTIYAEGEITVSTPEGGIKAMPRNLLYSRQGTVTLDHPDAGGYASAKRTPFDPRDGTRIADPQFVDRERGNYGYRPGSPALKLGIAPLPCI